MMNERQWVFNSSFITHHSSFRLKLSQAPGQRTRGCGGEVLERALAVRQAEARRERVADVEARVGVQLVKLARERLFGDALDDGAQLVGRVLKPFDEDDLSLRPAARATPRVLAQTRARLVLHLPRSDD